MNGSNDAVVGWEDSFALGLPEIDAQHKVLFDLMNDLWKTIVHNKGNAELLRLINALEQYTVSHFTAEETFLRVIGYADFDHHKAAHERFVARLAEEKANLMSDKGFGISMLHFLKDWLVNHILIEDHSYADVYRHGKAKTGLGGFFRRLWG